MIVLVTGGAGFIGSHLCRALLEQGHEVICLDNFFTGSRANLYDIMDFKNFEVIRQDVIMPISLEVDFIFNLACPASPIHYSTDPVQTVRTNVIGALNVLELAKRLKIPVFQASTSEVYGDPEISPQKESYVGSVNPIGPRACYDEGKRCAETLFFDYQRQYGLDVRVGRIFNTYGPRMHPQDGRVVSNFIVQALNEGDITIYGDGSQSRSFCYVDDMIQALIKMMNLSQPLHMPLNLGNPSEITISSLAKIIVDMVDSDSAIKHVTLPIDDPKKRQPDVSFAKQILDWEASTNLSTGLESTITYFRNLLKN